jgi:hypothetical protein
MSESFSMNAKKDEKYQLSKGIWNLHSKFQNFIFDPVKNKVEKSDALVNFPHIANFKF